MSEFRTGARLALDWGQARIGVAACDPRGTLAYPVETIANVGDERAIAKRLAELVAEYEPIEIVMGLPRHLKGAEGASAAKIRERAQWLTRQFPSIGVRLIDERLTTVMATRQLHDVGRGSRKQRAIIDQAAAVAILDHALTVERNVGEPGGELILEGTQHGGA
ncbi:Holliday junction resolvase RuvX [Nigerium massiliense]|uniref:Holliday junction resolvase RuvX n=1 Tax=Nigerium massiliense TaxID=1522317 RepID=UPI00058C89D8|nr:Holliday junction resolvase RuvX [Nigerium massiliense]